MTAYEPYDRAADELQRIATEARANSARWFPESHDDQAAAVPLAVHYAIGLAGEAGEVLNEVKKCLRHWSSGGSERLRHLVGPELADVFTYLVLLAGELGVDLIAAYEHKRDVNADRFAPTP